MIDQEIATAEEALGFIEAHVAVGLTPVMAGTSFYRHSFSASQFGDYIYYLDQRGTAGRCLPRNVQRVFDFVDLGRPVAGSLPDLTIPTYRPEPETVGRAGLVVTVVPGRRAPTLLEAAEAAIRIMPAGPERDDLENAVIAARRID